MAKQTFTSGQVLTASQMNTLQTNDYNMTVTTGTASYTLQASDVGQRRVQNMGSAGTVTVPNSTFTAGDALWLHSIGSGVQTIAAGAGLTLNSSAGTAPTLAQWEGGVVYFTSASAAIFFRGGGGATYGVATGGSSSTITVGSQNYTLLTFSSDGNLVVSKAGLFDVLLIGPGGGGGSGGAGQAASSGGGGGGGQIVGLDTTLTVYLDAGTYSMDVGAGQVGTSAYAAFASSTDFAGRIQAVGGGVGGAYAHTTAISGVNDPTFRFGRAGASGGGWAIAGAFVPDAVRNSVLNGFNGFTGGYGGQNGDTASTAGGGGGGAAGAGGNGSGTTGGAGGNGKNISAWITGSTYYACAGGGGGGSGTGGTAGNGGVAGKTSGAGNNGVNYGAGGGGSHTTLGGGNGADGAIFVRFKV